MEEEGSELLALFDFFWFRRHVLLYRPLPAVPLAVRETSPPPAAAVAVAVAVADAGAETSCRGAPPPMSRQRSALRRTLSDEVTLATSSDSALLVRRPLKLQTILSGKDGLEEEVEGQGGAGQSCGSVEKLEARVEEIDRGHRERKRRHRERRKAASGSGLQDSHSKSLSELEFEELKGFMDLGFTFSEAAESDQRLLSIVPALRRRGSSEEGLAKEAEEGEGGAAVEPAVSRPYLSEAWAPVADYQERRRSSAHDHLLRNWRVPAAGEGVDMKDHLRSWAHTVASAVR